MNSGGVLDRGSKTEPRGHALGGMGEVRPLPDAQLNADISGRAAGIALLVPAEVQMRDTAHLALACLLQESFPETLVRLPSAVVVCQAFLEHPAQEHSQLPNCHHPRSLMLSLSGISISQGLFWK